MKLDLSDYQVHLVLCPVDMRSGYRSLNAIASACLNIDVDQGRDCVVFMSSRGTVCKAIWSDAAGAATLVHTLRQGRFQRLLARAQDGNSVEISKQELQDFLDGAPIQRQKRGFFAKV